MHNKLPEELNPMTENEVLSELEEYFKSDRHKQLWEMLYPERKSFLRRILDFVKNNG
jgi:hypothetical protein